MTAIAISRAIGPVPLSVIVEEQHESELEITENAVEFGAEVTDHAYSRPKRLTLEVGAAAATATWQALKALQATRQPFYVVTGLDLYRNMLIKHLGARRNSEFANVLSGKVDLQEVIIVDSAYAVAPGGEARPSRGGAGNPGGTSSRRSAPMSSSRASGQAAQDRTAGAAQRGDSVSSSVSTAPGSRGASILSRIAN